MKLGLYIHLGTLLNDKLLEWASKLRDAGVSHCCYSNLPVDTVAVANGDVAYMQSVADKAAAQLAALTAMGMTVGVRPMPMILEQIKEKVPIAPPPSLEVPTPNFRACRTSIAVAKMLLPSLGEHNLIVQHEAHDTSDVAIRNWVVAQLGPASTFYYGFQGLWNKYGADFGQHDKPHVVHVSLNAAGAGDASAPGAFPGPAECTAKDILDATTKLALRLTPWASAWSVRKLHGHINVLPTMPVERIVSMICAAEAVLSNANISNPNGDPVWSQLVDVLMLRLVDDNGNTLSDPATGKHLVMPNVIAAIRECQWMIQ